MGIISSHGGINQFEERKDSSYKTDKEIMVTEGVNTTVASKTTGVNCGTSHVMSYPSRS